VTRERAPGIRQASRRQRENLLLISSTVRSSLPPPLSLSLSLLLSYVRRRLLFYAMQERRERALTAPAIRSDQIRRPKGAGERKFFVLPPPPGRSTVAARGKEHRRHGAAIKIANWYMENINRTAPRECR